MNPNTRPRFNPDAALDAGRSKHAPPYKQASSFLLNTRLAARSGMQNLFSPFSLSVKGASRRRAAPCSQFVNAAIGGEGCSLRSAAAPRLVQGKVVCFEPRKRVGFALMSQPAQFPGASRASQSIATLSRCQPRPNPSVEATRNGMAPWPRKARCAHSASRGQGTMPLRAPHLER